MDQIQLKNDLIWNVAQEPRCVGGQPASYLLLLSALDTGWQVSGVALAPSWDQNGFVYLVTLRNPGACHFQELILPRNQLTDDLLHKVGVASGRARGRIPGHISVENNLLLR